MPVVSIHTCGMGTVEPEELVSLHTFAAHHLVILVTVWNAAASQMLQYIDTSFVVPVENAKEQTSRQKN